MFMKTVLSIVISVSALSVAADEMNDALQHKTAGRLPEAEAGFIALLEKNPHDQKALEQLAIVQSWQNKFEQSILSWRRLLAQNRDNDEANIGLARVLYWKGERDESIQLLRDVTQKNGSHAPAWLLLGDVYMADNKPVDARQAYQQAKRLDAGVDPAIDKKIANAVAPTAWRFDAGFVADHFDKERGSENSRYLQLGYTTAGKTTWYAKLEQFHYFGEADHTISVGSYWLPTAHWLINVEAGKSNSEPAFRPDALYSISAEWLQSKRVQPLLIYRSSQYNGDVNDGSVKTVAPGVRVLFDSSNIELRYARTENLDDSTTSVSSFKWNWDGEALRPYIGYTTGEEATPPLDVAKINVLSAGLIWSMSRAWGMRFDYAYEDRRDVYKHHALGVGVSYFF